MIACGRAVSLVALAGLAGATLTAACQTDTHPPTCDLQQQLAQPGSALTLLPDARLDHVGSNFLLIGADSQLVRWATVTTGGQLGTAQSAPVPSDAIAGPWFAAAGHDSAADTILIAYGVPATTAGMVDVKVWAVPASGAASQPPAGLATVATVANPATAGVGPPVIMSSGRTGMRAGLAWTTGSSDARVLALDGSGQPQGPPLVALGFGTSPLISCVSFVDGHDDLAMGFLSSASEDDSNPRWNVVEVRDDGAQDAAYLFSLGTAHPSCPLTAANGPGYVSVWQNELGSLIGTYDGKSQNFVTKLFAPAVSFGGADAQPPLAGIGPLAGGDFGVILALPGAAEAWRIRATDLTAAANIVLPSALGMLGDISTVATGGALYASYADYSSAAGATTRAGQRIFVKISCF